MADKNLELDGVEMTAESLRLAEEAERKQNKAPDDIGADDDPDFDLLGNDDDDDDDDISKYYVDQSKDDDNDDDDDDAGQGDDEGNDDDDDDKPAARRAKERDDDVKPKSKAQKRIEELAEKRRAAEKEAFDAQMKNVELERRLAALEAGNAQNQEKVQTVTVTPEPNPKDFTYGEVDTKYVDALVEHRLSKERAKFQEEQGATEAQRKQQETVAHYQKRLATITEEGKKKFGEHYDKVVNTVDFPGQVARDILDSDQGVDISFYLAKNIGKLRELSAMSDSDRSKAIGRLEERFSARASAGKKRSAAPSTPNSRGKSASRSKAGVNEAKYGPDDQDAFDKAFFN